MKYTIGTVVSDWSQYNDMQKSFIDAGFTPPECQYISLSNVDSNNYCLYSGYNKILSEADGDIVILVHQDVRASFDDERVLRDRIDALSLTDPNWAVIGNAGSTPSNEWVVRITDKYGNDQNIGRFPEKVQTLDGNLIIIKKSSLVSFSNDLFGFHYYGWDICLNADVRGYNCYVIDWHIEHLGDGDVNEHFYDCKEMFINKWQRAFSKRKLGAFAHDIIDI